MAPLIVNRQLVRIVNFEICFSRDTPGPVEQTAMAVISERWGSGLIGEDGVVEGTGKRSLAVGREGVGSDPLGRRAACHFRISMLTCGIACSIAREIVYVWDSL